MGRAHRMQDNSDFLLVGQPDVLLFDESPSAMTIFDAPSDANTSPAFSSVENTETAMLDPFILDESAPIAASVSDRSSPSDIAVSDDVSSDSASAAAADMDEEDAAARHGPGLHDSDEEDQPIDLPYVMPSDSIIKDIRRGVRTQQQQRARGRGNHVVPSVSPSAKSSAVAAAATARAVARASDAAVATGAASTARRFAARRRITTDSPPPAKGDIVAERLARRREANQRSAKLSRERKKQHITHLEAEVQSLKATVASLTQERTALQRNMEEMALELEQLRNNAAAAASAGFAPAAGA